MNKTFNKNILSVGFSTKDVEEVDLNKLPVYLEYEDKILKHSVAIITEKPEIYRGISEPIKILTVKQKNGLSSMLSSYRLKYLTKATITDMFPTLGL